MYRSFRQRNIMFNLFELWVALSGVISAVVYFVDPASVDHNSVAITIGHHLAFAWIVSYGLSGLAIMYGLVRPSPRYEIAGLCLLGSATAVNGVAIISTFGMRGFATAVTFVTLTLASWGRSVLVFRRAQQYAEEADASLAS